MSLNFFNVECQYPPISASRFGLCDDKNEERAYPDLENDSTWIAEVSNREQHEIVITAIDKCVLNDDEFEGRGRCDCMLTTETHLYLIELKDKWPLWQEEALNQLESTILFLNENHDIGKYKKKKIFACNKRKKRFVEIENEDNLAFMRRTGFRKDIQAKIVVI